MNVRAGITPSHGAPIPLLVVAGLLVTTGAFLGPETRDTDMSGLRE